MERRRLISLHDILVAWQAGELSYRQALDLAQIDTLSELYDAARFSGVAIRTDLNAEEAAQAEIAAALIRGELERRAA